MDSIFEPFSFLTLQLPMNCDMTVTRVKPSISKPTTSITIVRLSSAQEEVLVSGADPESLEGGGTPNIEGG